jgi:quercetin dioxygenase-like cupin family protein
MKMWMVNGGQLLVQITNHHPLLTEELNKLTPTTLYPDWHEKVIYSAAGPQPQILMANDKVKIIMAGLEPGQIIPEHAEATAMYYILEGSGWMLVDGERLAVSAGTTVVMPDGTVRGMEAETRLAFLATRIA